MPEPLPAWGSAAELQTVGRPVQRASALLKVTGQAAFPSDVQLPGMAHAVLLRSTIARGRVIRFDARCALALPGVLDVAGPQDGAWPPYPPRSRPSISDEVRFVGEEIGVVVAETEALAREAARCVDIAYEAWPACITVDEAMAPGAPSLAADGNIVRGAELIERGDLAAAEAAAELIVEARYSTEAQHHNPLEPHGCLAAWSADGLTLWDGNQGGHMIREWVARIFGLGHEQVRVHSRFVGGAFGSKIIVQPYHLIAAAMARRLGRPVRLFMDRREEFIASHQRAATQRQIRLGATRSGRLLFIDEQITGQSGPCRFLAPNAAGAANGLRLHRCDAVRAQIRRVLTNTQSPVPFRGPTTAEDIFCIEQAVDELAHALDIDPLAFRMQNIAQTDLLEGLPYAGKQLERCYRLGAEAFGWQTRSPGSMQSDGKARGIGVGAAAYDATLYEASRVEIACMAGGRIALRLGISEIGCGADTVFAQIAAEALGLPVELIDTHFGDTGSTPRSIDATNHSRTSAVVGPSVRAAAHQLKQQVLQAAAAHLHADPAELQLDAQGVRHSQKALGISLAELVQVQGLMQASADRERPPADVFAAMFAAHFVEVEVDSRSGRVQVLRAICAHDSGRILNPRLAKSQVQGGFLQGMGMALQEQRVLDPRDGTLLNAAMWAYRTPGILDAPGRIEFIDGGLPDGGNSLGVKGIGEPPLIAAGAAIANAVFNAIGVRVRSYPITPAKVLAALAEKAA